MNMKTSFAIAVAVAMHTPMPQSLASEVAPQCIECHGENGTASNSGYPNLAGQHPEYLSKQLRDFREGRRSSPFMNIVASRLSGDELTAAVGYFAALKADAPAPSGSKLSNPLYLSACASCHGVQANGAGEIPSLRGQQMFYLREQLLNFRLGQRNNSPGRVMNKVADSLSDADIEALARYLSQM
jgi:cytochrome c553